ncbi:hypothetical protein [Frigoribacterium sp. PhB116]|uniref:hypothetical protein n=1 Tax=Frigoribacterium sp. PhB116 TaxID=2485174 RepID=UPI00105BBA1D|nr:hypothetical protein [Frigoribacterium sp. PhB116]TDT66062.1 hypothetical protein EDF20_0866 [Frigoribacterium sp. PhB116]
MKRLTAALAAVAVVAAGLVGIDATTPTPAQALSGGEFDPGYVISDAVFFNGGAMSEAQVQSFLTAQVGGCTNGACLDVLRVDTQTRAADAMCGRYAGAGQESVARIIAKVGAACGINPQVILVTLQKEQSLVNGSTAKGPSAARLERAMGYACPDNVGGVCDPTYAGVYNQIYRAAWQFKRYANPAGTSNFFTRYAPGANRGIQYNPNAACGSKTVYVHNQATANLYYYTPYTPNAAALGNLYGTGDGCSAYGNRNFWVYFNSWFGSPTGDTRPVGSLDVLTAGVESVRVRGWALDPRTSDSIQVRVYVGSVGTPLNADQNRPDIAAAYPGKGAAHGFDYTIKAAAGRQEVCVFAVAPVEKISGLGCRTVTIASASPVGSLDSAVAVPGGVAVRGWTLDPETSAPIPAHVYAGSRGTALVADRDRPDVARAWPGLGAAHGFSATVKSPTGTQQVCAYGINTGRGSNTQIGCSSVRVPTDAPQGSLDAVTTTSDSISVRGWALDGDTTSAVATHVYVDGRARAIVADQSRADIGRIFPGYGAGHGYSATFPAAPGEHRVCAYGINTGGSGSNALLGCRTVTVTNAAPVGSLDALSGVAGGISVRGWAWDPDTSAQIPVHVRVGSRATAVPTGSSRTDVAARWPGAGATRGFEAVVPASSGEQTACVYAIDSTGGANPLLGCRTVRVP